MNSFHVIKILKREKLHADQVNGNLEEGHEQPSQGLLKGGLETICAPKMIPQGENLTHVKWIKLSPCTQGLLRHGGVQIASGQSSDGNVGYKLFSVSF